MVWLLRISSFVPTDNVIVSTVKHNPASRPVTSLKRPYLEVISTR